MRRLRDREEREQPLRAERESTVRRASVAARADYIVHSMPAPLRAALDLAYNQRRDYRQAAADLGVTEDEARRRLRLGLQLLATAHDAGTLAGVLSLADVVISANTGPAHLAAAVGTPVVSLFAPVVPAERWAPYGVPVILLGDQSAPCADTRALTCPVPGHPCLDEVTGQDVVRAVHKLIQERPS